MCMCYVMKVVYVSYVVYKGCWRSWIVFGDVLVDVCIVCMVACGVCGGGTCSIFRLMYGVWYG